MDALQRFELLLEDGSVEQKLALLESLDPLSLVFSELLEIVNYARTKSGRIPTDRAFFNAFGTGGDLSKTINASTPACILASCRIWVCKVGARGLTSRWGSLDVAEELGIRPHDSGSDLLDQLKNVGFAFTTWGLVGFGYTRELREARRIFNCAGGRDILKFVGPGSHLLDPTAQTIGSYSMEFVPLFVRVARSIGRRRALIFANEHGIDELSNTCANLIFDIRGEEVVESVFEPERMGTTKCQPSDLRDCDSLSAQAEALRLILAGRGPRTHEDFVCMNAGALLYLANHASTLNCGTEMARQLIRDGAASRQLKAITRPNLS